MRLVSVNKRFNYYIQYSSVLRNGPLGGMTGASNKQNGGKKFIIELLIRLVSTIKNFNYFI